MENHLKISIQLSCAIELFEQWEVVQNEGSLLIYLTKNLFEAAAGNSVQKMPSTEKQILRLQSKFRRLYDFLWTTL